MTPFARNVELEQINEYRLEKALLKYLSNGGQVEKLSIYSGLRRKYNEMYGAPVKAPKVNETDDPDLLEMEKQHQALMGATDPKKEIEKLTAGGNQV